MNRSWFLASCQAYHGRSWASQTLVVFIAGYKTVIKQMSLLIYFFTKDFCFVDSNDFIAGHLWDHRNKNILENGIHFGFWIRELPLAQRRFKIASISSLIRNQRCGSSISFRRQNRFIELFFYSGFIKFIHRQKAPPFNVKGSNMPVNVFVVPCENTNGWLTFLRFRITENNR
jgi:hypothetical protein